MTINVVVDELLKGAERARGTAVIVDIFRATSQLATLLEVGVKEIYPALNPQNARELKDKLSKKIGEKIYLCGESDGITPPDFDFSNSPGKVYYAFGEKLKDKTVIATTTNGIKGLITAKKATEVITASFLNYHAVVHYIKQKNPGLVTIVGMGEFGASSPEDKEFSHFLKGILTGQEADVKKITEQLRNCSTAQLMRQFFGPSVNKDIDFCLDADKRFNVVPKLYGQKIMGAYKK